MRGIFLCALLTLPLFEVGCQLVDARSHAANPLGWPAKALEHGGRWGADTEVPLVRESGRLVLACADVLEGPPLLLESLFRVRGQSLAEGGAKLAVGVGGTVTAALNLPFFFVCARNVDIARDQDRVNSALRFLEQAPVDDWRYRENDPREFVFPKGTRVRASGKNLIWIVPGAGEFVQAAEESWLFKLAPREFIAQERSWGMVVANRDRWYRHSDKQRAITIIHEFYHQHPQLRRHFMGWTTLYWPLYGISFLSHGWWEHWAEVESDIAAYIVDHGLKNWQP